MDLPKHVIHRFWSKVDKSGGVNSCWRWLGEETTSGYGNFNHNRKCIRAHRIALSLATRKWPTNNGVLALHSCDNKLCCNPRHLRWGSHSDNMVDVWDRLRSRSLTIRQMQYVVILREAGLTYDKLGAIYKVHPIQAWKICNGKMMVDVAPARVGQQKNRPQKRRGRTAVGSSAC